MRICVFSDVHGNMPFFNAVLEKAATLNIERYYFLGDAVSYYPDGEQVIHKLREIGAICNRGNHESMLLGEFPVHDHREPIYQLRSLISRLSDEDRAYVTSWPETRRETIDGQNILFLHGTPENPMKGYGYEDSDAVNFDQEGIDVLFAGHTHRPWIRQNQHTLIVNVGSVGLPRDIGTSPCFAVYDTATRKAALIRLEMDMSELLQSPGTLHESVLACLQR